MVGFLRMQDYISANTTHWCGAFRSSATRATDLIGKLGEPLFLGIVSFTDSGTTSMCFIAICGRIELCSLASSLRLGIFTSGEIMDKIYRPGSFRTAK